MNTFCTYFDFAVCLVCSQVSEKFYLSNWSLKHCYKWIKIRYFWLSKLYIFFDQSIQIIKKNLIFSVIHHYSQNDMFVLVFSSTYGLCTTGSQTRLNESLKTKPKASSLIQTLKYKPYCVGEQVSTKAQRSLSLWPEIQYFLHKLWGILAF